METNMSAHLLNSIDPLKKQAETGAMGDGLSPMDPPDAYAPPSTTSVEPAAMHPFLRKFMEEHVSFMKELALFEEAILCIQKTGFTKELDQKLRHFFHFFDQEFATHSHREEVTFFPLLSKRLLDKGEHHVGATTTPVDMMEDDHHKAVQLAAVIINFLGLTFRLPDERSKLVVLDAALEEGKQLVELLRLHIFREDHILFPMAHQLISTTEFDAMQPKG
ncbi:MAG: hemerythrin domain-containing protein [Deltaproteobacteria bacterium]|nr:hemerythrin domain-containing protein [Deltaproteobacteria bacterium]